MPQISYFKVTSGLFFSILSTFECNRAMKRKELDTLIYSVGAVPGRWISHGYQIAGLCFSNTAPSAWRAIGKTVPGGYRPDTRNKLGRKYKTVLSSIRLLTGEDLAKELQLPPCFTEFDDNVGDRKVKEYFTAVESVMIGGVYYLQAPACMTHYFKVIGVHEITRTEHQQALAQAKASTA